MSHLVLSIWLHLNYFTLFDNKHLTKGNSVLICAASTNKTKSNNMKYQTYNETLERTKSIVRIIKGSAIGTFITSLLIVLV